MGRALAQVVDDVEVDESPRTLGIIFKSARTKQDKTLELISEQLKIRKIFLQAIENEEFDLLPGGVYTIGFIRSYARYLNLDHDAIIEQLKDANFFRPVQLVTVGDEQHFPTTRYVSGSMISVGGLLLIVCAVAAYFFLDNSPVAVNWPNINLPKSIL